MDAWIEPLSTRHLDVGYRDDVLVESRQPAV
jgi:hypothetical protein